MYEHACLSIYPRDASTFNVDGLARQGSSRKNGQLHCPSSITELSEEEDSIAQRSPHEPNLITYERNLIVRTSPPSARMSETSLHMSRTSLHMSRTSLHMRETSSHMSRTSSHMRETSSHMSVPSSHMSVPSYLNPSKILCFYTQNTPV